MPLFLFALPALLLQSDDNNNPLGAVAGVLFLTVTFALVVALIAGMEIFTLVKTVGRMK